MSDEKPGGEKVAEMARIFIALNLATETRRRLVSVQEQLTDPHHRIKWVAFDNLHLTMKFLGEIPPKRLESVYDAVRVAAEAGPVAAFSVRGLGVFPSRGMPRVVWAGVEERVPSLEALQRRLENELGARKFAREKRKFSPHVTLGRVRSKPGFDKGRAVGWTARIEAFLGKNIDSVFGEEAIREISVMQSHLGPEGALYEELEQFELMGGSS